MVNDKSKVKNPILNFITNDIRNNQEQRKENRSLFSKKEHLLELINEESKLNHICYSSLIIEFFINNIFLITNYLFEESTQSNLNSITEMNMWCDDLQNDLIYAAKDKQLNDFLVSLAPHVSIKYIRIFFLQIIKKIL